MSTTTTYFSRQRLMEINRAVSDLVLSKRPISFEEVPIELRDSLNHFIVGRTLMAKDGKPHVLPGDFLEFFEYLWKK